MISVARTSSRTRGRPLERRSLVPRLRVCRVFRAFTTRAFAAAADRRRRYRHRQRRRIFGRPFGRARARIRSGQAPGFFRDSREGGRGTRSGVCWRRRRRQGALSLTHSSVVTATLVDERRCRHRYRHRRYTAALRTAAAFLVVVRHGHTAHRGRLCTHDARCSKSLLILLRTLEFYRNVRNMIKLL